MQAFTVHGKEADARQGAAGRAPFATGKLPHNNLHLRNALAIC